MTTQTNLETIQKLRKDVREAAINLSRNEARFLVDSYYQLQDNRIRAAGQIRSIDQSDEPEPHAVLSWLFEQNRLLENEIKKALGTFSQSHPVGRWSESITGIGPVISAGLLAHIDMAKTHSPSSILKFAGQVPNLSWGKGEKRPFNAKLKVLCWKLGQSFLKLHNHEKDFYGKLYIEHKEKIAAKNEAGDFANDAAQILKEKNWNKSTEAYKAYSEGKLPKGHVNNRALRHAVKIFLCHYYEVAYKYEYGADSTPPKPYVFEHKGHVHQIPVHNDPFR